ncbi:MAG: M24/M37 family peptidase [Candidatus Nomurabacteria bacterium GW2011_GWF2_40_12]|nr:MAG: M24/M37 family peptidase [Candidatus Nomurabacteria bacterium GW2011_GWF2_40_12]
MVIALVVVIWAIGIPLISIKVIGSREEKETVQSLRVKSQSDLPVGEVKEYEIQSGDTFGGVMTEMGVPYEEALSIMTYSKDVFDFTKINTGKLLKLVFVNEAFAAMEYPLNSDEVLHVKKEAGAFSVTEEEIPYVVETVTAKGVITDSLFETAESVGVEDKTTLELADIFSSDIDFATDIQKDDSFFLVYEKRTIDGKLAPAGNILAAKFTNNGTTFTAFRYNDKFYNEEGKSLTRQFLKSPLNYSRISSGYSYSRKNPVTKQIRPHFAIDYAASKGTPVIATADGKVTTAGSKGGLGITVELKHGSYLTQYSHLSKIAKGVKNGVEIKQGEIIGYVGSTGNSTGPHLQYAMYENSNPINPITTDFPRTGSLLDSEKNSYEQVKNKLAVMLE